MTNHVARLYALATTLVVFFATWLAITTHPWTQASSNANVPVARIALLQKREHRLRAETRRVNRIVDRRFVLYRKALTAHGTAFHYLGYGSYLNTWRRRTALKIWTGWPTFPMIFVKGVLVGGFADIVKLIESGELDRMLGQSAA